MGSLTLTVQETVPVTNYEKSHFNIHHRLLPFVTVIPYCVQPVYQFGYF